MECSDTEQGFFLLLSSLVAFQGIAFAAYQASALRHRCPDGLLVQAVVNIVVGSILWYSVGFSLSFGASLKGFIGNLDHAFFLGIPQSNCSSSASLSPELLTGGFEMMLAIVVPLMMTTARSGHISMLGAVVLFVTWPIFVYYPLTHWIRGRGWLVDKFQILDDAGGLTVHAAAGTSALVFTAVFKPHVQVDGTASHHLSSRHCVGHTSGNPMLLLGGLLTILGWYGFNAGSSFKVHNTMALSILNSHISACTSAMCWVIFLYITKKNCRFADVLPGFTAGVVAVTSAPGSIEMWAAFLTGMFAGVTSSFLLWIVKRRQPVWTSNSKHDVTFVHGIPGIIGSIAAGLFAKPRVSSDGAESLYSGGRQIGVQLLGVLVTVVWSVLCTYLLIWFIRFTVGFNSGSDIDMTCDAQESSNTGLSSRDQVTLRQELFQAVSQGNVEELEKISSNNSLHLGVQDWNKKTLLHVACSLDQLQCVKFLLRPPGVDVHARDRWNATPLSEAIKHGHDRVVKYLLRHGASWFEDGAGDLLCSAVMRHDLDELERLASLAVDVNAPNVDGTAALHVAASLGSRGVVQYLVDHGADVNAVDSWGNTPLNYSDMHEHRAVNQLLESLGGRRASHHYSTYEICEVASKGNLQMLRHMVHNGATVCYKDFNRRTPLHVSAAEGHLDVIKFLLLQPGIDVNAKDRHGFTALLDAIVNGHRNVAEYLKAHAGTVDECKLANLVTEAVKVGDTKVLKRLLRWSGHVNICDYDGQTALHVAAACDRPDVVSLLLKQGTDANLINRFGQTPLQVAASCQNLAVEKELSKFMKLSKAVLLADDSPPTSCYDVHVRRRGRKHRTEPSYDYAKSNSWSSTDNSLDIRRQLDLSSTSTECNTGSRVNLSMADMQKGEQTARSAAQPTFLQIQPVSSLTLKAREMAGGRPEYV